MVGWARRSLSRFSWQNSRYADVGCLGALGSFMAVRLTFFVDPRGLPLPRYSHNMSLKAKLNAY